MSIKIGVNFVRISNIFKNILSFANGKTTSICDIHSACSPIKGKFYNCGNQVSRTPVINMDAVKEDFYKSQDKKIEMPKSVDALTNSSDALCFVELKSWDLVLQYNGTADAIKQQCTKYQSDLPMKLAHTLEMCKQLLSDPNLFDGIRVIFVLVTDIDVSIGIEAIYEDLSALAGISSDLRSLCNRLTGNILSGVTDFQTLYCECRNFDSEIAQL